MPRKSLPVIERVLRMVVFQSADEGGHWLFTGARNYNGYPRVRDGKRMLVATRVTLAHKTGDPGVDRDAAHLNEFDCPRHCINPDHLAWKTHHENLVDIIDRHGALCGRVPAIKKSTAPIVLPDGAVRTA